MSETNRVFKPDYRIATLAGLGTAGFIFGCILIFYQDIVTPGTAGSVFHEIVYSPTDIIDSPLVRTIASLTDTLRRLKEDKVMVEGKQERIDALTKDLRVLRSYRTYSAGAGIPDSVAFEKLNKALHFNITSEIIDAWDRRYTRDGDSVFEAVYALKDTALRTSVTGVTALRLINFRNDIRFFSKYPSAGVWLLSLFIFCALSFISISTCIYLNSKVTKLFGDHGIEGMSPRNYYFAWISIFLILLVMAFIWRATFYDEELNKNLFFMRALRSTMMWITILGYICGSACLAGFMHTSAMLGFFAGRIKKNTKEIGEKKAAIAQSAADNDADAKAGHEADTRMLEGERAEQREIYNNLLRIFNAYFVFAAMILTLLVLCSGGLFSLTNSLDFMRLLADDWGRSTARPDFVYLYGGIHTVLLLLFYIPAKMRFSEIDLMPADGEGNAAPPVEGNSKWKNFFNAPLSQLKELLVVVSPLLASLAQSLFDMFFK